MEGELFGRRTKTKKKKTKRWILQRRRERLYFFAGRQTPKTRDALYVVGRGEEGGSRAAFERRRSFSVVEDERERQMSFEMGRRTEDEDEEEQRRSANVVFFSPGYATSSPKASRSSTRRFSGVKGGGVRTDFRKTRHLAKTTTTTPETPSLDASKAEKRDDDCAFSETNGTRRRDDQPDAKKQPPFEFGRETNNANETPRRVGTFDFRDESSASPMSVASEGTSASLNNKNTIESSPSSFPGCTPSPGFTFGQNATNSHRKQEDPSPPNPAWAHVKTPTEFSPSMFAETHTHPGVTTTSFNTPPGSANATSTPMIFQSGGSSGGGGFSGSRTKPKSYGKSSSNRIRARSGSSNSSGSKMQNSSSNSNRMQAFPSVSKEAAKIAETSFAEGGPFSAQAVLNNSFSKVTIGGENNNNTSSPFPTSAFNGGFNFNADATSIPQIVNDGTRKPYKKFQVVRSPGSPKSPITGDNANQFARATGPSPSSRNSPSSEKDKEKIVNVEKEVKAYKLEANRLFQEASAFLNQDKDEQALKKFRAARDTYTRAIIMLESIAPSPDKQGRLSRDGIFSFGGTPFLPTRQLLGREAGTLLSNRAASTLMVIQIEEAKERFKDMSGKFTSDMLWKYRQKIQECIDDCMRARKADTTYMKPILRQAKCHERLADFTAACACYTTVVSSSKASEKEKEEARVELEHAKRLKVISEVTYLTEARRALRKVPINDRESFPRNELLIKSAITDATDIENRATHMPLDIRQLVACLKINALIICGQYKEALETLESFEFFASLSPMRQKELRNKISPPRGVEPEDDMVVRENIVEMTLFRIVVHYGLGDVENLERFAMQTNGFTGYLGSETIQNGNGSERIKFTMLDTFNEIRPDAGSIFAVLKDQHEARMRGNSAFSSGKYDEAEKHYTKCIAASNSSLSQQFVSTILCNRAAARMGAQKYIDAMLDCGRAIILDPTRAKAYSRRAAIFSHLRLFDKALEDLTMYEKTADANSDIKQKNDAKSRSKELKAVEIRLEQQYGESAPIHARAILGFSDDSSTKSLSDGDVTKAFKKLSLRAHADKVFHPNELPSHFVAGNEDMLKLFTEDANRVFNHLNVAKDALKTSSDRRSHEASEYQWDSQVSVQRRRASSSSNSAGSRYAGRHFTGEYSYSRADKNSYAYEESAHYRSASSSSRGGRGASSSGRHRRHRRV